MRIQTTTKEVYTYEELPEEIKRKVLEKHWDINVDGDWWYDYDGKTGFTSAEIKKYRLDMEHCDDLLTYKDMYFNIDRGSYIQFIDADFKHEETARKFLGVPAELWERVLWTINDCPHRETNTRLEWEFNYYDYPEDEDFTDEEKKVLDRAVERFADKVAEALTGLRNAWEWSTSREQIEETIKANEYEFDIDGNIA